MNARRRALIRAVGAAGTLACALTANGVLAQSAAAPWPTKPVRFVIPAPPGTAPDVVARILGEKLGRIWGQTVIIDNRPGAGGMVAFTNMKQTEKDDHQFAFVAASSVTLSPFMYKSNNVDIARDLTPVAFIGESPMMLAVSSTSPYNTLADLLADAKKRPDTLVAASPLQYSTPHLATDMLSRSTGVQLRAIPFPGSTQAATAVIGGDAQLVIDGQPALDGLVKGGRLKPLATFWDKRLPDQPSLPAVAETYPDLVINGWFGLFALSGLSPKLIEKVNIDMNTVLVMPDIVEKLNLMTVFPKVSTVPAFTAYLASERKRWEKALRDVGAQPVTQ